MSAVDINPSKIVGQSILSKASRSFEAIPFPLEWIVFGVAWGLGFAILMGLVFGAQTLKRSVWVSQFLFVVTSLLSLAMALFARQYFDEYGSKIFSTMIRFQVVLSTIATFNIVQPTSSKQNLGFLYSAFLGVFFGVSLLDFTVPVEGLLFFGELLLLAGSLYLGGRFLWNQKTTKFGAKTLVYQLTTVSLMSLAVVCLPELSAFSGPSLFLFGLLNCALLLTTAATSLSSSRERTVNLVTHLQKNLFVAERRLAKQNQVLLTHQNDLSTLEEALRKEALAHRQDSIRDHLRIRALEVSSQDIANGIRTRLRELQDDCQLVIQESKSSRFRVSYIKSYAERINLSAMRLEKSAEFLLITDAISDLSSNGEQTLNAAEFLKECLFLCSSKFKNSGIEIEIQSLATDLMIRGKPALLAQGFLGLIYNALEATETSDVRKVTLVLRKVSTEDGSFVEFGISNSGPGIPTAIKSRAFLVKERDGLGIHSLGLSMAFGIFEHAGGSLELDSEAVATTLVARLPLIEKSDESSLRLVV